PDASELAFQVDEAGVRAEAAVEPPGIDGAGAVAMPADDAQDVVLAQILEAQLKAIADRVRSRVVRQGVDWVHRTRGEQTRRRGSRSSGALDFPRARAQHPFGAENTMSRRLPPRQFS